MRRQPGHHTGAAGAAAGTGGYRPLLPGTRRLILFAAVLVLLAGVQLSVFSEHTATYFAWTIANPATAAFLGAAYGGSMVIAVLAARARWWADARIAIPTVFLFTALTLVVTLVYLDSFHLAAGVGLTTLLATWAWIAVYMVVPVALAAVAFVQWRTPGVDPPRRAPLPAWLAVLIGVQALALLGVAATLLVSPAAAAHLWPWRLTPLTARAIGVWVLSFGVAGGHAVLERDLRRLRPVACGYAAVAVLEGVVLARYGDRLDWGSAQPWCYLGFLALMLLTGVTAVLLGARRRVP